MLLIEESVIQVPKVISRVVVLPKVNPLVTANRFHVLQTMLDTTTEHEFQSEGLVSDAAANCQLKGNKNGIVQNRVTAAKDQSCKNLDVGSFKTLSLGNKNKTGQNPKPNYPDNDNSGTHLQRWYPTCST